MATNSKKSSVMDSLTLKPSETAVAIKHMYNTNVALFVWGPPGVAKSSITKQVATEKGIALVDIRLSQMEPTDLRGIPMPNNINGIPGMNWSAPTVLPRDVNVRATRELKAVEEVVYFANPIGDNGIHHVTKYDLQVKSLTAGATAEVVEQAFDNFTVVLKDKAGNPVEGVVHYSIKGEAKAILMLDEFNSAAPSVQAGAYQLVLDKRLGEYIVPKGVMVMAAGNRENDKGITFRMPTPIANRFTHVEMRSDFDDWQKWALEAKVDQAVVGYLTAFKNDLFDFDATSATRGFPTPRSWHFVSDILAGDPNLGDQVLIGLLSGAIGDGTALKFNEYRKNAADLPNPRDILAGTVKELKRREVSLCYALTTALCYELKDRSDAVARGGNKAADRAQWMKEADNFLGFMLDNFQPEVTIMGAKTALSVFKLQFVAKEMKNFKSFADKYKDLIMN